MSAAKDWDKDGPMWVSGKSTMEWYEEQMNDPAVMSRQDLEKALAEYQWLVDQPERWDGDHRVSAQKIEILRRALGAR